MKIILFEDNKCKKLFPFGLFKPLHDLPVGLWTLYSMIKLLDFPAGSIVREHFIFDDKNNFVIEKKDNQPLLFLNSSIEPDVNILKQSKS